jgi:signal transduction histidine kinase
LLTLSAFSVIAWGVYVFFVKGSEIEWLEVLCIFVLFTIALPGTLMFVFVTSSYNALQLITFTAGSLILFSVVDWRQAIATIGFGSYIGWLVASSLHDYLPPPTEMIQTWFVAISCGALMAIVTAKANREYKRMTAKLVDILAHELRTPLKALSMLSARLKDDFPVHADTYKIANKFELLTLSMQAHIDLQVSNSKNSRHQISMTTIELDSVIREALHQQFIARPGLRENIILHSEDRVFVEVNVDLFRSVIQNLLSNAVISVTKKNEGEDPKIGDIVISTRLEGNLAIIEVIDKGVGIDPKIHKKIFEAFYSSSKMPATGLGLTMVRESVAKMHGSVTVRSEIDQGAIFELRLPGKLL